MILDAYPLPCIKELLFWLKGSKYFLHLYLGDGYFHVSIAKEDVYKMVFFCKYGTFEYLIMPFGLINAPIILFRVINQVFFGLLNFFIVVCLDNILVFSYIKEDHMHDLNSLFKML